MEDEVALKVGELYDRLVQQPDCKIEVPLPMKLIRKFEASLEGKLILDAGCGYGRVSKYFCKMGFDVVGIDLSEKSIEKATTDVPSAKFFKADMSNLGSKFKEEYAGRFNGVWCCAAFYHIPQEDAENTLHGFNYILRENGSLGLILPSGPQGSNNDECPIFYYSAEMLSELFDKTNFAVKYIVPCCLICEHPWLEILAFKEN